MIAVRTSLLAGDLPDNLSGLRSAIEQAVPHGRTNTRSRRDKGAWDTPPEEVSTHWGTLAPRFKRLTDKYPTLLKTNNHQHLGTLGTGNHFIEVCLDEQQRVWVMLHSGSRGVGNAIGNVFITLAQQGYAATYRESPGSKPGVFSGRSRHYNDYLEAVEWAQDFARQNREVMMSRVPPRCSRIVSKTVYHPAGSGELPP